MFIYMYINETIFLLIIMLVVLKVNTAALSPRRAFILKYSISGRQARPSLGLLWIERYEAWGITIYFLHLKTPSLSG